MRLKNISQVAVFTKLVRKKLPEGLQGDTRGFPVVLGEKITIKNDTIPFEIFNVGLLIDYIYEKKKDIISRSNIDVWKVEIEETDENRGKLKNTEINIGREFGGERLPSTKLARKIFPDGPPDERIHILVQPLSSPATTGLKRKNSKQNMRAHKLVRTDGPVDVSENFYVPFRELSSTRSLEDVIDQNLCALLVGHFQSGKTSVLHYLCDTKANYFYVHSSVLACGFLLGLSNSLSLKQCTSCGNLCKEIKDKYKEKIVIPIDEFDQFLFNSKKNKNIENTIDEISELNKLISDRSIGIKSIVYTGTYSIVAMLKDGVPQNRKVIDTLSQESLSHDTVSNNTYKLFRETRTLKGSEKKCDLWVCNGKEYGFEIKVNSVSKDEISSAVKQAIGYTKGRKNACSMFVLNFVPSDSIANNHEFFFPSIIYPEGLYFEMVHILYSKADRSAQIFRCCAEPEKISFAAER
ncbi:hypothetical protein C1646_676527 [Rhizophagus diaphanus]|nr:hypothetical protein C1646_676527 [Rhizophagus diaphanus] [Rhizophagus sp. MUCL 43196]